MNAGADAEILYTEVTSSKHTITANENNILIEVNKEIRFRVSSHAEGQSQVNFGDNHG